MDDNKPAEEHKVQFDDDKEGGVRKSSKAKNDGQQEERSVNQNLGNGENAGPEIDYDDPLIQELEAGWELEQLKSRELE